MLKVQDVFETHAVDVNVLKKNEDELDNILREKGRVAKHQLDGSVSFRIALILCKMYEAAGWKASLDLNEPIKITVEPPFARTL